MLFITAAYETEDSLSGCKKAYLNKLSKAGSGKLPGKAKQLGKGYPLNLWITLINFN